MSEFCRSCGAAIVWLNTRTGKTMPVDAETVGPDDDKFDHTKHISHFATCSDAAKWRKRKPETPHVDR